MILERIVKCERIFIGSTWLRIIFSDGFLWAQYWISGFHKKRQISWSAAQGGLLYGINFIHLFHYNAISILRIARYKLETDYVINVWNYHWPSVVAPIPDSYSLQPYFRCDSKNLLLLNVTQINNKISNFCPLFNFLLAFVSFIHVGLLTRMRQVVELLKNCSNPLLCVYLPTWFVAADEWGMGMLCIVIVHLIHVI